MFSNVFESQDRNGMFIGNGLMEKERQNPVGYVCKIYRQICRKFCIYCLYFILHCLVTDGDTGDIDPNGDISNVVVADSALSKSLTSTFPKSTQLPTPQI